VSAVVFVETVRRHVSNLAFLTLLCLLSAIASVVGGVGGPRGLWMGFVGVAAIILGCQLIGPEFSKGTLQLVLAKPVNRAAYLLSRYAGVVVSIWIFFAGPFLCDLIMRLTVHREPFEIAGIAEPLNVALAFTMTCALLVLFGSFTRSYLNVAIYLVIETVLYVTEGILQQTSAPIEIARGISTVIRDLFPSPPPSFDSHWTMMVISNAAVAVLLACYVFRQREVPYGAD
jgi:ABC-type transport system involved in multi-copper enzyme maturation permease subunit